MSANTTEDNAIRNIVIFDTTLRDGEQSPGASMNLQEKLSVAQALVDLGVDVIEAGFPIASPGDFEAVREIARLVKGSCVCGLARCVSADIDRAWEALKEAEDPRIHVFLATSAIHREFKLRMSQEEIIKRAVIGVERAKGYCSNVEFSPEDACRTEIDFLCQVVEAAIAAGATTINIPDTVGYTTPPEMTERIQSLFNRVPNIDEAVISIHCHNDLGMAVANSLSAVSAGAGQIECAINGLGERAGNCSLEEVVMALRTRRDIFQADTRIVSQKLVPTSRLVTKVTGLKVPRNKAIVGQNAFAHESGVHQDGVLKERTTYEIMSAESVGFVKNDLVLGKHSGRAALADRIKSLGFDLPADKLDAVFAEFKRLADLKKDVFDADIIAIVDRQLHSTDGQEDANADWQYISYEVNCNSQGAPSCTVRLAQHGLERVGVSNEGDGPIHAIFSAVKQIVGLPICLSDFKVEAVSVGDDAQGEVVMILTIADCSCNFKGQATSTDVLEATIMALVDAINRIQRDKAAVAQAK
ncbi:MAG: 2-isopropylmalate synthase [Planctomycetia bacterium]|nr:2-isopropylmalate synthase [Planctomycetia bacterium]